jgi:thiamine pyrophosphokinase
MNWGLIALNGTVESTEKLRAQLSRYMGTEKPSFVVGVDAGCKLLEQLDFVPTIILGDFDSVGDLSHYKNQWPNAVIKTFPPEKDFTDAELAFDEVEGLPLERIVVIGGLGGRADHMLSILFLIGRNSKCVIIDELNYIERIEAPLKKSLKKSDFHNTYLSILPDVDLLEGIYLKGFKYPLVDATIRRSQTLGISNEIVEEDAVIEIESGTGFLVFSQDRVI